MDDNFVIITIDNRDYYIEASRLSDLAFINNKLVNISNSSITMVTSFDTVTTYPRITCSAMSQCQLRTSNTSNYSPIISNYDLKGDFNMNILSDKQHFSIMILLLFIIVSIRLMWKK